LLQVLPKELEPKGLAEMDVCWSRLHYQLTPEKKLVKLEQLS
jgi:hypothetical protein